jgi:hypothetical protein
VVERVTAPPPSCFVDQGAFEPVDGAQFSDIVASVRSSRRLASHADTGRAAELCRLYGAAFSLERCYDLAPSGPAREQGTPSCHHAGSARVDVAPAARQRALPAEEQGPAAGWRSPPPRSPAVRALTSHPPRVNAHTGPLRSKAQQRAGGRRRQWGPAGSARDDIAPAARQRAHWPAEEQGPAAGRWPPPASDRRGRRRLRRHFSRASTIHPRRSRDIVARMATLRTEGRQGNRSRPPVGAGRQWCS